MKVTILDGAVRDGAALATVQEAVLAEISSRGWTSDTFTLRRMEIKPCLGCFGCWVQTPGECIIKDAARDVSRAIIRSDVVIFLSPVTFGGYSSELKKALDRSICLILPFFKQIDGEIHHKPRYRRYPRLVAIGSLPEPDEARADIFSTLHGRNAINFHAPAHASAVVVDGEEERAIRARVAVLLNDVEVAQ
jgi:multimeric flavodoxin WrbA